jgi:pimeloyl-ACP methyl ester carboxylesterase
MERIVPANGIQLWCEDFGDPADSAIVLIMGLGGLGTAWPDGFCETLAAAGRHVIRFDNRDIGKSSKIDFAANPYVIADMAEDVIGLLDALDIPAAHLVGASMGGMIAQETAIRHPDRVLSITSWMSTPASQNPLTGEFSHGLPPSLPKVGEMTAKMLANPPTTREEEIEASVTMARTLAGSATPFDEDAIREYTRLAMEQDSSPAAGISNNQVLAFQASPPRADRLGAIKASMLIVHGTEDPILPFPHAEFMAAAAPDAKLLGLEGIGHEMPPSILPRVATAILEHTKRRVPAGSPADA